MKKITILGSTGSIGKKTLEIIENNKNDFELIAITAHNSYQELLNQAIKFRPKYIYITNKNHAKILEDNLRKYKIKVFYEQSGLLEICALEVDITISAITGFAALLPTLHTLKYSQRIGIANKESIVCAGQYILNEAKKYQCEIIPIDSEHNSIFQLLNGRKIDANIHKVIITASGGPFWDYPFEKFTDIKVKDALKHPNWIMGKKITIDSATMVNKALELIEAKILFNIDAKKLDVIIHPESIIHAIIQFIDGSNQALLACHDMAIPIANSIYYPKRNNQKNYNLDFTKIKKFSFSDVDHQKFPAIKLAYKIMEEGKALPLIFNSANEIMVANFLDGRINFLDIMTNIEKIISSYKNQKIENIEHIFLIDNEVRIKSNELIC
jgi:1-deoxy-D-xylulose-5-phosphate reductoisomerase